jgi:hypothetical protein
VCVRTSSCDRRRWIGGLFATPALARSAVNAVLIDKRNYTLQAGQALRFVSRLSLRDFLRGTLRAQGKHGKQGGLGQALRFVSRLSEQEGAAPTLLQIPRLHPNERNTGVSLGTPHSLRSS